MIFCIDANTYIWGVKKQSEHGQEEMIGRALHLFKWMDEHNHRIMIPTIVLAEILSPEPLEKHPVIMELISKEFILADFDVRAASQYGVLLMNRINELKKIAAANDIDKQKMKVDHLIIASAIVGGANCIYSHDKGLKAFGQRVIEVRDLPPLPPPTTVQNNLFGNV